VFSSASSRGAREVRVVGLDGGVDLGQVHRAVGALRQRLRLDAAQHRGAASLPAVGMGHLADDVLVAAAAVAHQPAQVALRAGGHEQRGLETEVGRDASLQRVDRGVVAEDVVAQRGGTHRVPHRRGRAGDGVAAQVDRPSCGGGVGVQEVAQHGMAMLDRMDSGWNCTPSSGSPRWRTPMISPSSAWP
jgi:hypothetical protein